MKVLIYLQKKDLAPKGGPNAVGYYIYLNAQKDKSIDIDFLDTIEKKGESKLKKILKKMPKGLLNIYRKYIRLKTAKNILNVKSANIDFSKYDIIHFHTTFDLYKEREALKNYKGIVVLTSHSPVPTWCEHISDLPSKEVEKYEKWYNNYKVIDEYAFDHADYITFPCEEAEEPYFDNWSLYTNIRERNKDKYKYILTGIPKGISKKTKEETLSNLNLPNCEFLISYVGRHNRVKGYDNLKILGEQIFKDCPDIHFVVAGKEYPLEGLKHNQWHEIGWTDDPHSLISASDVFVLPNKATYFDIVMLEILSLGKIVVATRTGGNKYFEKLNPKGIFLYNTIEEAKEILLKIKALSPEERKELGDDNARIFDNNFTDKIFYDNYVNLLKGLTK